MNKQSKIENNSKDNLITNNKFNLEAYYLVAGPNMETDRDKSTKITNEYSNMFTGI